MESYVKAFLFLCVQVIVDGTYALHAKLRSLLDIRVAVVIFQSLFFVSLRVISYTRQD